MTRLAVSLLPILFVTAGCAGPIETRVKTASSAQNIELTNYDFSNVKALKSEVSDLVEDHVRQELKTKGYQESKKAPALLDFSIADRPSTISVQFGEGEKAHTATKAKENKPFQSCIDREHRLIVTLRHRESGAQLYQGIASEYHCKAKLRQTVPHLVKAALSDLGGNSRRNVGEKVLRRSGLD